MPSIDGIFYRDSMKAGDAKKPVLVLLHGFFMDSRMFYRQHEAFADRFRVISVDLRGFGQTTRATGAVSLYDMIDDVLSVVDALGIERFYLGGMSMGGYLAQRMALKFPERVAGLILIATQAGRDNPETVAEYSQLVDNWGNEAVRSAIIDNLLPVIIGDNDAECAFWRPVWQAYRPEAIAVPMQAMLERDDIDVTAITCPTLIVHGADDVGIPPSAAQQNHLDIRGSILMQIPGARHAVNLTHYEAVNAAMDAFFADLGL